MTECEEVADNMSLDGIASEGDCRRKVRQAMPDETHTVVDNVAEALWTRWKIVNRRNPL